MNWLTDGQVLSCRVEVQTELVQQVLIFIMQSKHLGMVEVCEFLEPFLNYSIVRMPSSVSVSSFIRSLLSSLAGLCCSIPLEAVPVITLLIGRLKFFPCNNADVSVLCIMQNMFFPFYSCCGVCLSVGCVRFLIDILPSIFKCLSSVVNVQDLTNISHCLECIVDAYVVVLQQLVEMGSVYKLAFPFSFPLFDFFWLHFLN